MFSPRCCNNICSTSRCIHLAKSPSVMLNQTHLKCFYSAKHTYYTPGLWLARWVWTQGEGRLMLQAHYPQCSAGPLPARLRRSLCCCSPAPLIPLLGWTLWPSSCWIPNPVQDQKTCFCDTFLHCSVCILLHKETQGRAAQRFQAWVDVVCAVWA